MVRSLASTTLLTAGSLLIALSVLLLGRAYGGQWVYDVRKPAMVVEDSLPARLDAVPTRALPTASEAIFATSIVREDSDVPSEVEVPSPEDVVSPPSPSPVLPTSTPAPPTETSSRPVVGLGRPVRLVIPSIHVDAPVTGVGIKTGAYEIPWWDVGWHEDSALLGVAGNTIFNGHLDTIDAGRVFKQLHRLEPGDLVYVYSSRYRTTWAVESTDLVPNSEGGFVESTDDVRVTLYTCEGSFNWATRRYSHYRVIVARFVDAIENGQARSDSN